MKNHADFFRSHMHASFGRFPLGTMKISDWVTTPSASLTAPLTAGYPQSLQSLSPLSGLYGYEASRFVSAALESYSTVKMRWSDPEDRDGLAWRLISLYYSAYYSAHAILRLSGITVTHIENWHRIDLEFQTYYQTAQLPSLGLQNGYHVFTMDLSGTALSLAKAKIDSAHGSHTAVWSEFRKLAERSYGNSALNTNHHLAALAIYLQKLSMPLPLDGISCRWPWMPVVRNRINYRLPDEIWGRPAKRISPSTNKEIHSLIVSPSSRQIADGAVANSVWLRFSASCMYMLSLLCDLLRDMEIRARSKSFLPVVLKDRAVLIDRLCGI